jgi:hypothetical protein
MVKRLALVTDSRFTRSELWRRKMPNANRDKGNKTERDVAGYFRAAGITTAERRVVTGWHRTDRSNPDLGDLMGTPGLCIQIKNVVRSAPRGLAGKMLVDVMAETEAQRAAVGAALGLLIEKRPSNADVGTWWAHLPANDFIALVSGQDPHSGPHASCAFSVRLELRHITDHLVRFSAMCVEQELGEAS